MKNFTMRDEAFICEHCKEEVSGRSCHHGFDKTVPEQCQRQADNESCKGSVNDGLDHVFFNASSGFFAHMFHILSCVFKHYTRF
jgi:hypothetical protein